MSRFEEYELSAKEERLWEETRAAMMSVAPHFTHLFYTLLDNTDNRHHAKFVGPEAGIPVAATDARSIILNAPVYFKWPLGQRLFGLGHEIMHNVYDDVAFLWLCGRTRRVVIRNGVILPFDAETMQISMDLRINDLLVDAQFGLPPPNIWWDKLLGNANESVVTIYERMYKRGGGGGGGGQGKGGQPGKPGQPGGGQGKPGQPGNQPGQSDGQLFDELLEPGEAMEETPHEALDKNDRQRWTQEITAASALGRAQGKLKGDMQRVFGEVTEHKVKWEDHMKGALSRTFGGGAFDWKRPDRRFIVRDIYVPGRSSFACDLVVIGGDTSGSITNKENDITLNETAGMLAELRPKRIIMLWCDAAVQRVDEVVDAEDIRSIRKKGVPGGGGTDFRPVFDWIAKQDLRPDALLYFTDGDGTFPDSEPAYPVIWGAFTKPGSKYPFGTVVEIPREKDLIEQGY